MKRSCLWASRVLILLLVAWLCACGKDSQPLAPEIPETPKTPPAQYPVWFGVQNSTSDTLYVFWIEGPEDPWVFVACPFIDLAQVVIPPHKFAGLQVAILSDSTQIISGHLFALQRDYVGRIWWYHAVSPGWWIENYPTSLSGMILYGR